MYGDSFLRNCVEQMQRSSISLQSLGRTVGVSNVAAMPRVVHVSYEVRPMASYGGLGGAVESMLLGHRGSAVVVLPYFGFTRQGEIDQVQSGV